MLKVGKKMMLLVVLVFVTTMTSFAEVKPIFGEVMAEGNQIHWIAESVENTKFFIVQRSKDGVKYFPLAMVSTKDGLVDYNFTDEKAGNKSWFYRVIDVDYQGVGTYTSALYLEYPYGSASANSIEPPTNITINDHIVSEMNRWLNELEFPTISKLGIVAHFTAFPTER